jgi:ribosomal protein S3AE
MALKKKFINIDIPLLEMSAPIMGTPETVQGKTLRLDMTRKLRGKSLEIVFKIFNKDGNLYALPKKLEILKFFIRRVMRKRASYVEDSLKAPCKDSMLAIKPFLVTRKKVSRAIRNHLRETCREFIIDYIKDKSYLELCEELLMGILQKAMLPKLKKVYPLSFSDLRILEAENIDKIDYNHTKREVNKKASIEQEIEPEKAEEPEEETIQENIEEEENSKHSKKKEE